MKKNIIFLSVMVVLFFAFSSCKNTFNIAADWKEIPVVYGLMDADSSVQYIKIEKAFLDQKLSALQMAQSPDSMYYKEKLTVKIEGFDIYNHLKETHFFSYVNGDTIGLPRQSGIFAKSPNMIYILKSKLNAAYTYYLTVTKQNGTVLTASSTNLVGKSRILLSSPLSLLYKNNYNSKMQITLSGGVNTVYCNVSLRFKYTENAIGSTTMVHKWIDLPLFNNLSINSTSLVPEPQPTFDTRGLYQFIQHEIPVNNALQRTFEGIDFFIFGVNQNLVSYVDVQNAQAGITSGTAQVDYSNIKNGLGIFASRSTQTFSNYSLTAASLDSLKKGMYTYTLGFDHYFFY